MKLLFVMFAILAFIACSRIDQRSEISEIGTLQPWYSNRAVRNFSDEIDKDTLQVTINGETLITGQVYLKITNHKGNVIFWDSFPVTGLIEHEGLIEPETDEKRIKAQLDNFFDLDRFVISSRLIYNRLNVPDSTKSAWEVIQADPKSVYFSYRSSQKGVSEIAYSKGLKKVLSLKKT